MMNTNQIIGTQNHVAQQEMGNIFNVNSDEITIHDKDFIIIHANNAAVEILGLELNKILGQKCVLSANLYLNKIIKNARQQRHI